MQAGEYVNTSRFVYTTHLANEAVNVHNTIVFEGKKSENMEIDIRLPQPVLPVPPIVEVSKAS